MMERKKFILYGAGTRGEYVLDFLGCERIVGFIDNDKNKQRYGFKDMLVMDLWKYKECFQEYMIIVTPYYQASAIARNLESNGIYNYITLRNGPDHILNYSYRDILDHVKLKLSGEHEIFLWGLNLYSLLLYEEFRDYADNIYIVDEIKNDSLRKWLREYYDVNIISPSTTALKYQKIFITKQISENELEIIKNSSKEPIPICNFTKLNSKFYNQEILKFKDVHKGRRCFIVGTGPSLCMEDLDRLYENGDLCISMNSIYLAFSNTKWRPNYYVVIDLAFKFDELENIENDKIKYKFFSDQETEYWQSKHPSHVIKIHHLWNERHGGFASDLENGIYGAGTVTHACVQLAAYMGCKEIYLLGIDFSAEVGMRTHFIDNYERDCKEGTELEIADATFYKQELLCYEAEREYADTHDIEIYNATRGGYLEVFKRVNFDDLF